ncbi:MAG TPA: hypothetical protein VGK67_35855 [Myxococcales bacterium]|jgi:hypothetical protein
MSELLSRGAAALGRPVTALAVAGGAVGVLAFLAALATGRAGAALGSLSASWLFAAGLAAGGIALSAAMRLARARWAAEVLPVAESTGAFFLPALALLAVILLGARSFVPWAAGDGSGGRLVAMSARLLAASAVLFLAGGLYLRGLRRDRAWAGRAGVAYLLLYVAVLSVWAYDLVMGLAPGPPSTVVPAYYFTGAFVSAIAFVALLSAARGRPGPDARHDLGKLLFAFIVFWSYLLWALFLPTWYGNVPEEVGPLLARWRGPFKALTVAVLLGVFAFPFWLLFSERLKRMRTTLAVGAAAVSLGMLGERFLLVLPSLGLRADAASLAMGAGVTLGVLGLLVLSVGARLGAPGPEG